MTPLIFAAFFTFFPPAVHASPLSPGSVVKSDDPARFIENGSYGLIHDGKIIASDNIGTLFVPASISKILTSLVAINTLGLDHRFATEFYTDTDSNLYIKGFGDPFLVSEDIPAILATLKKKGITEIRSIYLDDSSFDLTVKTDGAGNSLNPYDASCGGMVVNFNTMNIKKGSDGRIVSAESQTPLLPMMEKFGKGLPPGTHRVNISNQPENITLLAGQLFRAFQGKVGITGTGAITAKTVPGHATKIHTHLSSKNLEELLVGMFLYSNNFTANQIFLTIGAKIHGYPATWDKARSAMEDFIKDDPALAGSSLSIIEGSGLSRKNKVSAKAMLHLLELFKPYALLLPEQSGDMIKSGTLTGVYSYAGYLKNDTEFDSFVIILNQKRNTRDSVLILLKNMWPK